MFGVTATVQGYLSEEPRDEGRLTAQRYHVWRYGWGHAEDGARRQSRAGTVTVAARDKAGREWVGIGFFGALCRPPV